MTTSQLYHNETADPVVVLPDITISDEDESCEPDLLSAAQVTVETIAKDSAFDRLEVSIHVLLSPLHVTRRIEVFSTYICAAVHVL